MSRTNGSTLLHASPVRFLIWCKFLAGVARAAKEIRAAQIFIALIKHLFCDIFRAELVIHKIVFVPKGSLTLEGFVFPNSNLVMKLYWATVSLDCHLFDVIYTHKLFNEKKNAHEDITWAVAKTQSSRKGWCF